MAEVDVKRLRELVWAEARRLDSLPPFTPNVDRITEGRVSGMYLALSFLRECTVQSDSPGENQQSPGTVR